MSTRSYVHVVAVILVKLEAFKIRLKEHGADIKNGRVKFLALIEHSSNTSHHICLEDTKFITNENHKYKWKMEEALEIIKHPLNLNRDGGLEINRNWVLLLSQNPNPSSAYPQ